MRSRIAITVLSFVVGAGFYFQSPLTTLWKRMNTPGITSPAVFEGAKEAASCLRRARASDYRAVGRLTSQWEYQRLVEAVWPVEPNASSTTIVMPVNEPPPCVNGKIVCRGKEIAVAVCPL